MAVRLPWVRIPSPPLKLSSLLSSTSVIKSGKMDEIEEIRSKIDLVELISESLPLKRIGRNFKALCPFHAEKTPSFIVSPERQIWKCFGCNKGGDVYRFLMEMERLEFGEALRVLAKRAGIKLSSYRPTQAEAEKEKLYQVNHLASEFYHYLLLQHRIGKKALSYILQRGISKDSLAQFKIGYSPPMWEGLQKYLVGKKGFAIEELEKAGLIIKGSKRNSFYDRFRDRLMFPLLDHRSNVVGFAGRLLKPEAKEAKYVNTAETLVYHKSELLYPLQITKEEIKKQNSAVVVEGELDAISCYQVGIKNVVAIKGSALTEPQARLLKRFTEDLVLSLDADTAGDMAARRGIEIADSVGFNLKVVVLEKYKDPDEAAQKEPEYLKKQIKAAENVYDFYLDSAFKRFRGKTAEEKKKIGQELIPIWAKIEDEIVKNLYIKKLADRLGVNEEAIILQIEKQAAKGAKTYSPPSKTPVRLRKEILEEYFLALILQAKETESLLDKEIGNLFSLPANLKLISLLREYLAKKKKFSSQFFFKALPAELKEAFNRLYLVDFSEKVEDKDWVAREIKKTRAQLELLKIKEKLQSLSQKIKAAENQAKEAAIEKEIRSLTQKLARLEKS